jgi:hypothetical protein
MRPVINCVHSLIWAAPSAFGVTWRIVDIRGWIGTRLVIYIICLSNLSSAFGKTWQIVDVCGRIGTRLVINWVCLWNLGSASGITRRIVEWDLSIIASASWMWAAPLAWPEELWIFVVKLGQDLSLYHLPMECGQPLRHNLTNCGCSWSNWDETCH